MEKMDTAEAVADELNRGCYAENVLKYFFDKPDSSEQALTDSEDDLSDDESDMIRLYNIPNLQLSEDDEDQDEEECIGLASDELDRKISEAISVVTFEGNEDREMQKIRNFDCKCYTRRKEKQLDGRQSCSQKLSPDIMYNIRLDSLAAEKEWQDMRIIGHLEANRRTVLTSEMITSKKKAPTKRKCARTTYFIGGIEICKNTFVFLMGIGRDTLADIVKHYEENGARPRLRKKHSLPRPPARFIKSEDINRVVDFIKNYAEDNAILLPGQQPGHKYCHVKLLPTHVSKASVWRLYVKSAKELGERAVCKTSFKALWNQLLPHIKSSRPRTDLCWQCQSNTEQLIQSANLPDDRKSEAVKKQQDHLSLVQKERDQYNDLNAACRKICFGSNLSFGPSLPASFTNETVTPIWHFTKATTPMTRVTSSIVKASGLLVQNTTVKPKNETQPAILPTFLGSVVNPFYRGVPGWAIALLVLACVTLLLIFILILLLCFWCCTKRNKKDETEHAPYERTSFKEHLTPYNPQAPQHNHTYPVLADPEFIKNGNRSEMYVVNPQR